MAIFWEHNVSSHKYGHDTSHVLTRNCQSGNYAFKIITIRDENYAIRIKIHIQKNNNMKEYHKFSGIQKVQIWSIQQKRNIQN